MAKVADLLASIKHAPGLHYKNPRFPLNIKLPSNLEVGNKVYIHGTIWVSAVRFAVNLKTAEVDGHNYFHFNPRFDDGCVVRNSRLDEAWGDEEREGDFPFEHGMPFLIGITPHDDHFEVEVNGTPFIDFHYRDGTHGTEVNHISMWGDVTVFGIHVPVTRMPVPLELRIPKNAFLGDIFFIEGDIPDSSDRFFVNLQCGTREDADILYHFNPRFGDDTLICNNRCADSWGDEERLETLPVHPGEHFILTIVVSKEGYIPFFNGNPMPIFGHRLDYSGACNLVIGGDVNVKKVLVDCPPIRMPPRMPDIDIDNFEETTTQALRAHVPLTLGLPGNFAPGKVIYISGKVDDNPTRFAVNLQCGEGPDDDIALHLNPRWDDDEGSILVLNSREANSWGEEIRLLNPIVPGEEVDIHILGMNEGYSVLVNGEPVIDFEYRMDNSRVTHVHLDGSLVLYRMLAN